MRLQKYLAQCGVASRRKSEELISKGLIKVNGVVTTTLGTTIDPSKDTIAYRNTPLILEATHHYIALNKPTGVISTCRDTHQRDTVIDLLPSSHKNVVPAGRLDKDTSGLLILSNDGDFIYKLTHPKFECEKEYKVTTKKPLSPSDIQQLEQGIEIEGKKTSPAEVTVISPRRVLLTIHEGRNRQIRKMIQALDNHVTKLKRIRIGSVTLASLKPGTFRPLSKKEISSITS